MASTASAIRRAVLVTGSTSGIGLGIATSFARAGYDVMLNGFGSSSDISSLISRLSSLSPNPGSRISHSPADLSNPSDIEFLVSTTADTFGRLDVLVNNAGIQHVSRLESFPLDKWAAVLNINLTAPFLTTKAALPHMQAAGWGRVINIASAHGLVASEGKAAYVAAKHGLIGLTKVTALENAMAGITANAICPGWVDTPLVRAQVAARAKESGGDFEETAQLLIGEKQPMAKFTHPEAIGQLALFLCSDAAQTITGSEQRIDGGWVAR